MGDGESPEEYRKLINSLAAFNVGGTVISFFFCRFIWMLDSTKAKTFYARFHRNVLSLFNFQFLYPRVKLSVKVI